MILGAGLDSFALRRRDLLDRLAVFELDHPDTQRYKLARLEELGVAIDPRVHFVAVDFEDELPRHASGKLYTRLLRDRYWAGRSRRI